MSSTGDLSISRKTGSAILVIREFARPTCREETNFSINGYSFNFSLYPACKIPNVTNKISFVYLTVNSSSLTVHYKVSILGVCGKKLYTREYDWTFDGKHGDHIGKLITCAQLLYSCNGYLFNDKLTLLCEVEIIDQAHKNASKLCSVQSQMMNNLSEDFQSLLSIGKLCDVTLIAEEKEFHVHKAILAARSPVFAAMFVHDCEEKRQNKVNMTDIDMDVCEELIRFIYTGKVQLDRFAMDLLAAADKYQLDSLKTLCEHYLSSCLAIETVANVLVLADMHRATDLKEQCIEYIADNAAKVKATDGWNGLNTKLMEELFLYLALKAN